MDSLPSTRRVLGCFLVSILAWLAFEAVIAAVALSFWPTYPPGGVAVAMIAQGYLTTIPVVVVSLKWAYK